LSSLHSLKFDENGLIVAVIQDDCNGQVLMVGYMNQESLRQTLDSGRVTFWSRSRRKLWVKGETSGHTQAVRGVYVDCDQDCLLVRVEQVGPACHEGYRSCFFRSLSEAGLELVADRLMDPAEIYGAPEAHTANR